MNDVTLELDVIQAVGRALARLDDPDAQRRVIRWINDRFQATETPARPDAGVSTPPRMRPPAGDPLLGVEELSEFFERPGAASTLHRDTEAGLETTEPVAPVEPVNQSVDTLVRGFVVDFQRLALEWQGA